ncbi:hypothetical protein BDF19DRAFT_415775 [Syncephalis fuscata]|nr:hypothetical protein BDF19DRAFT_415775 [Syncephalis fuscata]
MSTNNDASAQKMLHRLIAKNDSEFDISYNNYLANHMVHHLYSLYALGADAKRLERAMNTGSEELEPLSKPTITITADNWKDHFSDLKLYTDYLQFFHKEVDRLGKEKAFDIYVPQLLVGAVGAAGHPLIHLGYAIEFDDTTVLAEALAYACARRVPMEDVVDGTYSSMLEQGRDDTQILDVITLVSADRRLDVIPWDHGRLGRKIQSIFELCRTNVTDYFNRILITEDNVDARLDELFNAAVTVYAGTAYENQPDFFLLHGVTSLHATRVLYNRLPIKERVRLVRAEWLFLLVAYIGQGRPIIQLDQMIEPYRHNHPWSQIIAESMATDDQHTPKLVYAMKCAEQAYGDKHGQWRATAALTTATIKSQKDWQFHGHGQQLKNTTKSE